MKNLMGWVAVIAVAVGFKFYNKSSDAEDVRLFVDAMCEENTLCLAQVDAHYDTCFDSNYDMGGRRTSPTLDIDGLMMCINDQSEEVFAFVEYDEEPEQW